MLSQEFIFSDERKYRIKRHLLFWGCVTFYIFISKFLNPSKIIRTGHLDNPFISYAETVVIFMPQAFLLVYPLLYFILPRYLFKGKYLKAALWILALAILVVGVNAILMIHIPWYMADRVSSKLELFDGLTFLQKLNWAWMVATGGTLVSAPLAVCIKMSKHYYLKNLRNQQLQKENIESQLQILKAQVHPHFLFNTLNNIYSKAQNESPGSAKMIIELSHILRYVLEEGKKELVPLENELQMLIDYVNLEKLRYDDKLDVHVSIPGKTDDIYIAPLLLLPFIENCFKHGTSKMLNNPWVNLKMELQGTSLFMKLMNGKKPSKDANNGRKGTGIENVKKRLDLLYQDRYNLQVNEDEEVFVVNLSIELTKMSPSLEGQTVKEAAKEYA
jgi:sensor histidine kinase YesM